jgi:hypothetical protein
VLAAGWPVWTFCRAVRATALRSTAVWIAITTGVWVFASALAVVPHEFRDVKLLGAARFVACIMLLAPVVSVLGARRPGELAWNFIVLTLLLIYAQPALEQVLLGKQLESNRIGIDAPRIAFYSIIAGVGALNYLPTRFRPAAILFGIGMGFDLAALGPWDGIDMSETDWLSAAAGMALSAAAWCCYWSRTQSNVQGIDEAWRTMRDGWGVLWSTRVRQKWTVAARHYGWNMSLDWGGLVPQNPDQAIDPSVRQAAEDHLKHLLRRFFDLDK